MSTTESRSYAGATLLGRASGPTGSPSSSSTALAAPGERPAPSDLLRALAEIKGQAQFLLYLADQLEDSLLQLDNETDPGHGVFLCKVLGMYSAQLEAKHQAMGDRIAEACQEIYVTVRAFDVL